MSQQLNFFEPIETQIKPANGNKRLVDYGIQNDGSDYRIHVGYKSQHIYVFPTKDGKSALERQKKNLELKRGRQVGVSHDTFNGYAVPISSIDNCQGVLIPVDIYNKYQILKNGMTTTQKGILATSIVVEMLKRHLIKLPISISVIDDKDLQIRGTDILVRSEIQIQVKCDFLAGEREHGGTGNVFLQIRECNTRRLY